MTHNSLPGFDAWLTHNPLDNEPEPTLQDIRDAERDLGEGASDDQVFERACLIASQRRDHAYESHMADQGEDRD